MAKKEIVNKDYQLINARYKLTSIQTKMLLKIISLINNKDDSEFLIYQIPLSFFDFLTNHKHHNRLAKECDNILEKVLTIDTGNGWLKTHWFSSIKYQKKEGLIICSIDPELKPYLLQLKKRFKPYEIKYVMSMESEYAMRIYELCKQYENTFTKKREFELTELHELMQVPKSYKTQYIDFKRKVLEISVREINKHSDIFISYKAIKRGRAVFWIEFTITKNETNIIESEALENSIIFDEIKHKEFKILFQKFGFEDKLFEDEFRNFCLFNNDNEVKITIDNFTKWCMQKKRKAVEALKKSKEQQEKAAYKWNFRKAKYASDKLKDYFMFDVAFDWQEEYYWKDIKTFEYNSVNYSWQKVLHPDFGKEETLLFVVEQDEYLANTTADILDVEVS